MPEKAVNDRIIEEIKDRCDLVELVGDYLHLEKKGKNYVGLCPFHQEKTPSFTVSPEKQLYYCFGCGEGGDHFKFLMNLESYDFSEALTLLAERTGVNLPREKSSSTSGDNYRENLFSLNQLALKFFRYVLSTTEGKKAREYLQQRGISEEAVDKFELGFAPAKWDAFLKMAQGKGFTLEQMQQAGLVVERSDRNGFYDRFRNRVMFPIYDVKGKVVGFGGRSLEEGPRIPKYLNSPQTAIFDKGRFLYGLYQGKSSIRRQGKAIIMEGYTDVITSHQEGIDNAVASLGTALTMQQARQLHYQAGEVVIAYDADEGGKSATLRGMEILRKCGLKVRVAEVPGGYDPDSYLKDKGVEAFQDLINEARNLMDYQMNRLKQKYDLKTAEGKTAFCEEFFPLLESSSQMEKEHYFKILAEEVGVSEAVLRGELKRFRAQKSMREKNSNNLNITGKNNIIQDYGLDPAEELLLKLLLSFEGVFEKVDEENNSGIFTGVMQKIIEACRILKQNDENINVNGILSIIKDDNMHKLITQASFDYKWGGLEEEVPRMIEDCLRKLKVKKLKERRSEIERELKEVEKNNDRERVRYLFQEWEKLKSAERELYRGVEKEGWLW